LTYVVCHHNWSFLEGAKHTRTLKAGRHYFPFHLEIGGSLPSSISTLALGGASIAYKLRAVATRPLLAHNLQAMISVPLLRSFTSEALEYQQTLEIENTWPGKIMYSVVLPHKAWAVGDKLASLVKFSPLAKGVVVESIFTNVIETTKIYARSGHREEARIIASSRHDFIEGRPVLIESNQPWLTIGQSSPLAGRRSPRNLASSSSSPQPSRSSLSTSQPQSPAAPLATLPSSTVETSTQSTVASSSASVSGPQASITPGSSTVPSSSSSVTVSTENEESPDISSDIVATIFIPLVDHDDIEIIPSHTLEPITISHRVRWSIYIRNPDMHVSELRCSLPLVVLHKDLLTEARGYTRRTRRAVLQPGLLDCPDAQNELEEDLNALDELEDRELPSYTAHVRDRVANMYLPETATMRITNPWAIHGGTTSPAGFMEAASGSFALNEDGPAPPLVNTHDAIHILNNSNSDGHLISGQPVPLSPPPTRSSTNTSQTPPSQPLSRGLIRTPRSNSGYASPIQAAGHVMSHLPHVPGSGVSTPLDWINSELIMSLHENERRANGTRDGVNSRIHSRANSRAASPERSRPNSRPISPVENDASGHGHGGHGHRGLTGLLKAAKKGLAFTKHHHSQASGSQSAPSTTTTSSASSEHFSQVGGHRPHFWAPSNQASTPPQRPSLSLSPDPSTLAISQPAHSRSRPSSRASSPHRPHASRTTTGSTMATLPPATAPVFGTFPYLPLDGMRDDRLLHRALTEVPDYSIASRGFIGGVPPLSSMQGLPSYEECARSTTTVFRPTSPPLNSASQQDLAGIARPENRHLMLGQAKTGEEDRVGEMERRTASDGDLVRKFSRMGMRNEASRMNQAAVRVGSHMDLESETPSGNTSEDEGCGLQMRTRRK